MFYHRRASPKHRYNIIEVDYGGGGHRTRLRDPRDQLLCLEVPPCPVYKGSRGEAGQPWGAPRRGGVLLLVGVGLPSFLVQLGKGRGKEGEGKDKERGRAPPSLVQFGPL